MNFIDGGWKEIKRLWSIWAAVVLGVLNGAVFGLAVFAEIINPWLFLGLNIVGYGLIAFLRILKQPESD